MEARKRFDFKCPFPTLKQRAILTVCRHWIDNTLVPQLCDGSSGLACLECEVSVSNLMPDAIKRFLNNLRVPNALKADFYHVLNGLRHQLSDAFEGFFCCRNNKIGVHIDDSGRFDYLGFLRCCFKKYLNKDLDTLYALFTAACSVSLLPEIDLVLKKIVTMVDGGERDSEMLLEQPSHQSMNNKHLLTYRFLHEADVSMIDRLNATSTYMRLSKCQANQANITITLETTHFCIDAMKKHVSLLGPSLRNQFVRYLIGRGEPWHFGTAWGLKGIKYLDRKSLQDWALHFGERKSSACFNLLIKLLDWPFTQLFVATFMLLSPHIKNVHYCQLFDTIVSKIPRQKEPEYATLHYDLLYLLWCAMPLSLKQDCVHWQRGKEDKKRQSLYDIKFRSCSKQYFLKAMIRLKTRAPLSHNKLVSVMRTTFNEQ